MTENTTPINWITLNKFPNYDITDKYPFQIGRKQHGLILKQTVHRTGYYSVMLNRKSYSFHRIIAEQFIPNPDNLPICDHKNRNITDNRLENLRYTTASINRKNISSRMGIEYEYLDELPEDTIPFTEYEMRKGDIRRFENLHLRIENQTPQFLTSNRENQYRILYNQNQHVRHADTSGKHCSICFSRIQKQIAQAQQKAMDIQKNIAETQKTMVETQKIMAETLQQQILLRK
jgi:hypothetical protein